jgi:hypothetical protein
MEADMEKFIGAYGFTEVTRDAKHTVVGHGGNMGNTEDNVRENFDAMFFEGAYNALSGHRHARKFGHPSYNFGLRIPNSVFIKMMGV